MPFDNILVDPTDPSGARLWVVAGGCLTLFDGNAWGPCAKPPTSAGLGSLIIKPTDRKRMLLTLDRAPPLLTTDGGASWAPVTDPAVVAVCQHNGGSASYSFSGKTIALVAPIVGQG